MSAFESLFLHLYFGLAPSFIAAFLFVPVFYLARKRVTWCAWELLAIVLPGSVWAVLMQSPLSSAGEKSLANLGEPVSFAIALWVAVLVRIAIGRAIPERFVRVSLTIVLVGYAVFVFFTTPFLPE